MPLGLQPQNWTSRQVRGTHLWPFPGPQPADGEPENSLLLQSWRRALCSGRSADPFSLGRLVRQQRLDKPLVHPGTRAWEWCRLGLLEKSSASQRLPQGPRPPWRVQRGGRGWSRAGRQGSHRSRDRQQTCCPEPRRPKAGQETWRAFASTADLGKQRALAPGRARPGCTAHSASRARSRAQPASRGLCKQRNRGSWHGSVRRAPLRTGAQPFLDSRSRDPSTPRGCSHKPQGLATRACPHGTPREAAWPHEGVPPPRVCQRVGPTAQKAHHKVQVGAGGSSSTKNFNYAGPLPVYGIHSPLCGPKAEKHTGPTLGRGSSTLRGSLKLPCPLSTVWNLRWPFTSLPGSSQLFRALMQTMCRAAWAPSRWQPLSDWLPQDGK